MSPRKLPTISLTIGLLKESVTKAEAIEDSRALGIKEFDVTVSGRGLGTLHVRQTPSHEPSWAKFFTGHIESKAPKLKNSSVSAVLLTEVDGRLFALIFGYGRHLLKAGVLEERFGLKATLNSIDPDRVQAVDITTLEAHPFHGKRQASRATTIREFGLNFDQDLLRGTVGRPKKESLGSQMAGTDTLTARVAVSLTGVRTLLRKYLEQSKQELYRKHGFSWVDHLAEVRDPAVVAKLNTRLASILETKERQHVWAAIPEIVEWTEFDNFRFGSARSAIVSDDITIDKMLESLDGAPVSLEVLRRRKVHCMTQGSDQPTRDWPYIKCLTAEIPDGKHIFLLNAGTWYRISQGFVDQVAEDVRKIGSTTLPLGTWGDETEKCYNRRMASQSGGALALMDQRLVKAHGASSPVEFCDLMTKDRKLIHVKKYGQSSVLSHLFSQGVVSATAMVSDAGFRKAVNKELPPAHRFQNPDDNIDRSAYEVCFVIGTVHHRKQRLPFFSQVTLRNAYANLTRALGLKMSLTFVPIDKLAPLD